MILERQLLPVRRLSEDLWSLPRIVSELLEEPRFMSLDIASPVRAWMDEEAAYMTAEIPGIDPKDLKITVKEDTVTVSIEPEAKKSIGTFFKGLFKKDGTEKEPVHTERNQGRFLRTLRLPFRIDASAVEATYKWGVLTLRLPKSPEHRPHAIEVRGA